MYSPWVPVRQRVQSELIKRGHCVGCTRSLAEGERRIYSADSSKEAVLCACGRAFLYDTLLNSYRRATFDEWEKSGMSDIT